MGAFEFQLHFFNDYNHLYDVDTTVLVVNHFGWTKSVFANIVILIDISNYNTFNVKRHINIYHSVICI